MALIEDIIGITGKLKEQMESNLPFINSEIDQIIRNKETSMPRIEQLLDTLLDYMHLGVGEPEFKRLNTYYASFNQENAGAYDGFYQELEEG